MMNNETENNDDRNIIAKKKAFYAEFQRKHQELSLKENRPLQFTVFYLDKLKELSFIDEELIDLSALIELAVELGWR